MKKDPSLSVAMISSSAISSSENWCQLKWFQSFSLFFLFISFSTTGVSSAISYSDHCASIVPEATPTAPAFTAFLFLEPVTSHYTGGDRILGKLSPSQFSYHSEYLYKTNISGLYKLQAHLIFRSLNIYHYRSNLTHFQSNYSQIHKRLRPLDFFLYGFWSVPSRKLCMVGSASLYSREGKFLNLEAVFKLNFARNITVYTSLVTGILESLASPNDPSYFEPISISGFPQVTPYKYNYTLVPEEGCSGGIDIPQNSSLSLESREVCSMFTGQFSSYELKYPSKCNSSQDCTPFGGGIGYLPSFVSLYAIQCSVREKKLRILVRFRNSSYVGYYQSFDPNTTLVGEGSWDGKKNRLCVVACRILNQSDPLRNANVGDCSIRLSLRYPAAWSIRKSNGVEGQIWSNKTSASIGYFERIKFHSSDASMVNLPGLKYEYTEMERVRRSCSVRKPAKRKGDKYPDGNSQDMRFDLSIKQSKKHLGWGYAVPIFVGNQFYDPYSLIISNSSPGHAAVLAAETTTSYTSPLNISYEISFRTRRISSMNLSSTPNGRVKISAEGVYDGGTGHLCMVGCRNLGSYVQNSSNDSMDCEIRVNFQFPSKEGNKVGFIMGSIESMRKKEDALYFEQLDIWSTSFTSLEAKKSIWRMDFEIIMVLISNTLACVFVGLQLFHVKKQPDVLPSTSLVMLLILTLGHMIPLVLNFEALFLNSRNRQTVLYGSGGWLEVNEVIVRVVTMVAFLLQFRLLQLAWMAKVGTGNEKGSWVSEIKTLYVSLPLYILGGSVALLVNWKRNKYNSVTRFSRTAIYQQHSLWGDLRSYAGLVLDGFLFPQIILNIFQISRGSALSHSFYIGTTFVRLLPHAYDLYRGHTHTHLQFDKLYIYANHRADFYSTSWDVIIPCGGILFAAIIFLQQRFGGRCILPRRFRELEEYEMVPVVSSE